MNKITRLILFLAIVVPLAVSLATPRPAYAIIDEIIGALCRGSEVVPPGQVRQGKSFVRALQATGFIESIDFSPTNVTVNFDPDVPNSKFISVGPAVTIRDGFGPGVDLTLSPEIAPDPDFPAYANCRLFPPSP